MSATDVPRPAVAGPDVRGPGPIARLCLRCFVVLIGFNVVALGIVGLMVAGSGSDAGAGGPTIALAYSPYVLLVALVPLWLVGFPAGLLTARLLAGVPRESLHVLVFAVVGAVLSVALCAMVNLLAANPWFALVAAAEGAIGAGVARWWTGRVHLRREPWSDAQGAALPWGRIAP